MSGALNRRELELTLVAYPNGERDYDNLPNGLPAWKGNLDVGHMATWSEVNGGEFGNIAVKWLVSLILQSTSD